MSDTPLTRRSFLAAVGVSGATGLAGCSDGDDSRVIPVVVNGKFSGQVTDVEATRRGDVFAEDDLTVRFSRSVDSGENTSEAVEQPIFTLYEHGRSAMSLVASPKDEKVTFRNFYSALSESYPVSNLLVNMRHPAGDLVGSAVFGVKEVQTEGKR